VTEAQWLYWLATRNQPTETGKGKHEESATTSVKTSYHDNFTKARSMLGYAFNMSSYKISAEMDPREEQRRASLLKDD
jgi:hypothetical protein